MKSDFLSRSAALKVASLLILGLSSGFSQATAPPYRIHCGGEALVDTQGNFWEADGHYSGGQTYSTDSAITGTDTPALYQTERWNDAALGDLTYSFDVPDGVYNVRLHFAEIYAASFRAGARVFDVDINGTAVVQGLDVFAESGADVALIKEYKATSKNGAITIDFTNSIMNAKISAIEILPANPAGAKSLGKVHAISQLSIKGSASDLTVFLPYAGAYTLELRDLHGGLIARKTGQGLGEQRFASMRPGLYFLDIKSGKTALTKKFCLLP